MLTSCPPHVCPSVNCVFNQRTRVTPWLCLSYDFLSLHESEADEPLFTLLTFSGFYYIECMCLCVACVCVCVRAWMYQIPLYWYRHTGLISTFIHGKRGSLEAVVVLVGAVLIVISQVDKCVEQPCSPFISILCSAPCFFCLQTSRLALCSAAFARQVNISAVFKGDIFYKGREIKRRKRPPWLCRL